MNINNTTINNICSNLLKLSLSEQSLCGCVLACSGLTTLLIEPDINGPGPVQKQTIWTRSIQAESGTGYTPVLNPCLSAQCISSIGQIIKSVCVSVSKSVSESVCHTKRVERSTDRNLRPIFTTTKVASQK